MNNKAIFRSYNLACDSIKSDNSEENKQRYLIIFNELEIILNQRYII